MKNFERLNKTVKDSNVSPEMKRARNVDLIEMPDDLKERCANCIFIKDGYCKHPKVEQQIKHPEKACCGLWDNKEVNRKETQGL